MGNGSMKTCSSEKSIKNSLSSNSGGSSNGHRKSLELSPFDLSVVQKQVIIDSWQNVDDKISFVERVFVKIFTRRPSMKTPFRFDEFIEMNKLRQMSNFRQHASLFKRFLTLIVENLNHDEIHALKLVNKLAMDHSKIVSAQYFNKDTLQIFTQSMVDCFEDEQKLLGDEYHGTKMTQHIMDTWTLFLTNLFNVMLRIYNETNQDEH